jgi:hypothetical protein
MKNLFFRLPRRIALIGISEFAIMLLYLITGSWYLLKTISSYQYGFNWQRKWNMQLSGRNLFPFPLSTAKLIGDYFNNS